MLLRGSKGWGEVTGNTGLGRNGMKRKRGNDSLNNFKRDESEGLEVIGRKIEGI